MPRLEHVLWVVVAAFMVLWCHTIVAGASQNYLLFSWPDHYLKPGECQPLGPSPRTRQTEHPSWLPQCPVNTRPPHAACLVRTGWLPGWAVVAVTGVMRAQTRFMVTLMKLIGYWGPEYEHTNALGLTDPTIPGAEVGRWVDRSNPQWSSFRDSLPLLAPAFLAAAVLSRATQRVLPRLHRPLMVVAGLAFLAKAHGARALFFLAASVAYYLAAAFLPDAAPAGPFVWALNLAMLYLIRIHQGFSAALLPRWLAGPLDSFGGDLRWDVCFNISALRLISFAIDMTDARRRERRGPGLPLTQGPAAEGDGAQRDGGGAGRRVSTLPLTAYTLGAYLEYLCYPPLYIAGPIVTFDNFAAARKHPPPMLPGRFLAQYAFRACLGIFCVEFLLHFNYLDFLTAQVTLHAAKCRNGEAEWQPGLDWHPYLHSHTAHSSGRPAMPPMRNLCVPATVWPCSGSSRHDFDLASVSSRPTLSYTNPAWLPYPPQGRRHVDLSRLPVHQLACISFAYLVFLWLKFLSFWRFFRFFALLDGIPAPENMRRCICNNMSVQVR